MAALRDRWSAFGLTLTDDANAAAARATLGSTSVGDAVYIAASADAAQTAIGGTAIGKSIFVAADAATVRLAAGVPNSGPLSGLRNLIINGNFAINQRAYVSGTATSGANQYTLDRWRVVTSGQNATFTASGNGNLVTAPAGGLEQVIEGLSIAGGTYVINWTGTATCTVGGVARAKGDTFTLTANTDSTIRFTSGTVGEVQVEPGSVVTGFESRPVGVELHLCCRYFWRRSGSVAVQGYAGGAGANAYQQIGFPSRMRATPTLTPTFGTNTNSTSSMANTSVDGTQVKSVSVAASDFASVLTALDATAEL